MANKWSVVGTVATLNIDGTAVSIDTADIPESGRDKCFWYGLKRRSYDCHSGYKGTAEKVALTQAAFDAILAGGWDIRGAGDRFYIDSIDFEALAEACVESMPDKPADAIRAKVAALQPTDDDDDKTRKNKISSVKELVSKPDIAAKLGREIPTRDVDDILGI